MAQPITVYETVLYYIILYLPYVLFAVAGTVILWLLKTRSFTRGKYLTAKFLGEAKEIVSQKVFDKDLIIEGDKTFFEHGKKNKNKGRYEVMHSGVFYEKGKSNSLYHFGNPQPLDISTLKIPKSYGAAEIQSISDTKVWKDLLSSIFSRKEIIILFLVGINIAATAVNVLYV